jgi:hypothetical protein
MARRWLTAVGAVLVLAGCTEPAPTPTPTAATAGQSPSGPAPSGTPTATADDEAAGTAAFVAVVRQQLPDIAGVRSDEEIAAVAEQACVGLSNGLPADDIVAETRSLGTPDAEATDQATARELIKLAIDKACPDQSGRIDDF